MVRCEVLVVLILHVLFDYVLHLLRDDDYSNHSKPQRCLNYSCPFLHALEPLQWLHDPLQGKLLDFVIYIFVSLEIFMFIWIHFGQRIPLWWRWYYWANPVAWTLYGLLVSQYGDDEKEVKLSDGVHQVMVKQLLEEVMGYKRDFLGVSAIMVVSFCVFFSLVFAFAIKAFNFQRR